MAQLIDLKDLLKHEILDLYSAEEQILDALPKMIEKATSADLKSALRDHLKVTEQQKNRLDDIKVLMGEDVPAEEQGEKKGFFSRLFGGSGTEKCKGTEGLIKEGEKMMGEDMTSEVMDAAIISSAQKIEHYEICGYGTAAAYARELGLSNVAGLLQQTLDEEYMADDSLTALAVGKLNIKAENAGPGSTEGKKQSANNSGIKKGTSKKQPSKSANKVSGTPRPANNKKPESKAPAKKAPAKNIPTKKTAPGKTTKNGKGSPAVSKSPGNKSASNSVKKTAGKKVEVSKKASSKAGKTKSIRRR